MSTALTLNELANWYINTYTDGGYSDFVTIDETTIVVAFSDDFRMYRMTLEELQQAYDDYILERE
jgi:hypothetical protein